MTQTLSDAKRAAAVAFIRAAVSEHGDNETAAALAIGISQQVLNRALKTGAIGNTSVQRMANKTGKTIAGIAPEKGPTREVEVVDRYPSRPGALEVARLQGKSELAIAGVAKMSAKSDEDPGFEAWLEKVDEVERILTKRAQTVPIDDTALMETPDPTPRRKKP